ncbi:hypothetical protein ACMFMF_011920 [Clarireedia jacksonii]
MPFLSHPQIVTPVLKNSHEVDLCLVSILLTIELGSVNHVGQSSLGLSPLTSLETTVRIDPKLFWLEELQHLLNSVLDLLLTWDTRRVDVVDTRADVTWVSLINEDLEELSIRLAVLNGENISVKSSNGVEEVLELGVTEMRVDLGRILNTGDGETERLDSPVKISLTFLTGAERKTLTKSWLVDLNDVNTGSLKVNNFITKSQSKLLSLDRLVNVVTREGPSETGDWSGQHTLHWLLGDGDGIFGLLDSHWRGTRDVTNNDRRTNASRTVGLDPCVSGEGITVKTLTEVLDHVVTLWLTVDVDIKIKLLLDLDDLLDLLLNELLVLLSSNLTLGELVTLNTDFLGLGERTDGGGWEKWETQILLLLSDTDRELGDSVVVLLSNLGLTVLDLRVVGSLGAGTRLDGLGISLELGTDRCWSFSNGLSDDGNLNSLFACEGEPVSNFRIKVLLACKSMRGVKERAGGGNDDAVLAELLNSGLNSLNSTLKVGLPDVTTINNTGRQDSL